jgi:SAM-dependent methyltransferase
VDRPRWAPDGIDVTTPSAARIYDYYLGGSHNFEVDREVARQVLEVFPDAMELAQTQRAFLRRAVRFCVDQGINQFLDIGSGIPTAGNVHELAQAADPNARVVYVDTDPVAVAHSRAILAGNDQATIVQADLRDPTVILSHPETRRLIDLDRPIGLLMVGLLYFIPDADDPAGLIKRFHSAVAPGTHLVITQWTLDVRAEEGRRSQAIYARTPNPLIPRSNAEVCALLEGWTLLDPGIVLVPEWRPDPTDGLGPAGAFPGYGAVARKDGP